MPPFDAGAAREAIVNPPKHEPKRCGRCGAPMLWTQSIDEYGFRLVKEEATGVRFPLRPDEKPPPGTRLIAAPLDYEPTPDGNVRVWARGTGLVSRALKKGEEAPPGIPLRKSHYATCPFAEEYRKRSKKQ